MDCGPPGSPVHGISQARILEWVAIAFCIHFFLILLCLSLVLKYEVCRVRGTESWVQPLWAPPTFPIAVTAVVLTLRPKGLGKRRRRCRSSFFPDSVTWQRMGRCGLSACQGPPASEHEQVKGQSWCFKDAQVWFLCILWLEKETQKWRRKRRWQVFR